MFSTPNSLKKRTGKADLDRYTYLKELLEEYKSTGEEDKKEQVIANLGNFAYDPINYEYFRRLDINEVFLENLINYKRNNNFNLKILHFSIAALCNLCLDPKNREYLVKHNFVNLVLNCLAIEPTIDQIELILNVFTILIFMTDNSNEPEEVDSSELDKIKTEIRNFRNDKINFNLLIFKYAKSANKRLSNLACLLLKNLNLSE